MFDVDRAKTGSVAPDDDNFVVPKLINFLDRIFQPRREVVPSLPVDSRSVWDCTTAGSKKMNMHPSRKLRAKGRKFQKWARRVWQSAACQLDVRFLGKNQDSSARRNPKLRWAYRQFRFNCRVHVIDYPRDPICGYESGPVAHKPFHGKIDLLVRPGPKER